MLTSEPVIDHSAHANMFGFSSEFSNQVVKWKLKRRTRHDFLSAKINNNQTWSRAEDTCQAAFFFLACLSTELLFFRNFNDVFHHMLGQSK